MAGIALATPYIGGVGAKPPLSVEGKGLGSGPPREIIHHRVA